MAACALTALLLPACTPPPCSPQRLPGTVSEIPLPQLPPGSPDVVSPQEVYLTVHASLTPDGRFVAYAGPGSLKVPVTFNELGWIILPQASRPFVFDRTTGATTMIPGVDNGFSTKYSELYPTISDDGRYVAFTTNSPTAPPPLSPNRAEQDVTVHDRATGISTLVSVGVNGEPATGESTMPMISGDGRYIAYMSSADNLVPDDTNETSDVFVYDQVTGVNSRVSVASDGTQAADWSGQPSISADGRFVSFSSQAQNLIADDFNDASDVFVRDRSAGTTTRVSLANTGDPGNGDSYSSDISDDGRYVVFQSDATNLVACDVNQRPDVFFHDRETGTTMMMSVGPNGESGNDVSARPRITPDGRHISFDTYATSILPVGRPSSGVPVGLILDRGN